MKTHQRRFFFGCVVLGGVVGLLACSKHAPTHTDTPIASTQSTLHIANDRQQRIGMTTAVAVQKDVRRDIRTAGRVAFDPALAIAQQEFLALRTAVPSLTAAARSRLKILGMSDEEIHALARSKKPSTNLYLPDAQSGVWVYATIFPSEMNAITPGTHAVISLPTSALTFSGTVRGIDPIVNPVTRSARARIEVAHAGGVLRPDAFVNVTLQSENSNALTIPKSAVLYTGTRTLVFVVSGPEQFEQREISTGIETDTDVIVRDGLTAGERVVTQAAFLVDSESQLKPATPRELPNCPTGEAWDVGMSMCMPKHGE